MKKNLYLFVIYPVCINLFCITLYFSGIKSAQQFIAPTIESLPSNSWREFGLLEQLQNIYLLIIACLLLKAVIDHRLLVEKVVFFLAICITGFIFLEEIDYGLHFYELATGQYSGITERNWHNQKTDNGEKVDALKKVVNFFMLMLFVALPLTKYKIQNSSLRSLILSPWIVATCVLALIMSKTAHFLNDQNFGMIAGIQGNLDGNISEFREANNYYAALLYTLQLIKISLVPSTTFKFGYTLMRGK